jgi:hypothetical protein
MYIKANNARQPNTDNKSKLTCYGFCKTVPATKLAL